MLPARLIAAAGLALALAGCSSGGASSSSGAGARGSTSTAGTGGAGGASTTTSTTASTSSTTATGTGGAGGAGPGDAGPVDAAGDALGKGGLPPGDLCGDSAMGGDAGTACGSGLACCYPCKQQMCDSVCVVACSPKQSGCIGGCIPQI